MHLLAVSVYILLSDRGKAASSYCTSISSLLFARASFHMAQFRSVWLLCYSMCLSGTQRPLGGSQGLAGPQAGGLARRTAVNGSRGSRGRQPTRPAPVLPRLDLAREEQELIYPSAGHVHREGIWSEERGADRALHHFLGVTAGLDLLIPTSKSLNTDSSKHEHSRVVSKN